MLAVFLVIVTGENTVDCVTRYLGEALSLGGNLWIVGLSAGCFLVITITNALFAYVDSQHLR